MSLATNESGGVESLMMDPQLSQVSMPQINGLRAPMRRLNQSSSRGTLLMKSNQSWS